MALKNVFSSSFSVSFPLQRNTRINRYILDKLNRTFLTCIKKCPSETSSVCIPYVPMLILVRMQFIFFRERERNYPFPRRIIIVFFNARIIYQFLYDTCEKKKKTFLFFSFFFFRASILAYRCNLARCSLNDWLHSYRGIKEIEEKKKRKKRASKRNKKMLRRN